jgi:hypothetical protein
VTNDNETAAGQRADELPQIWACVWKSNIHEDDDDHTAFESRIPRLMEWLRALHSKGQLVACGGGAWENHAGGLTLIRAAGYEEAKALSDGTPMNEIGTTTIMVWDVYFADLNVPRAFAAA